MSRHLPDLKKRQHKRVVNHFMRRVSRSGFFFGCNGHVNKLTAKGISYQDPYSSDVHGESMVDGSATSCSVMHCAPEVVPPEHVTELVTLCRSGDWKKYEERLAEVLGWPEEAETDPDYGETII